MLEAALKVLHETSKLHKGTPIKGYALLSEDENERHFIRYTLDWGPSESLIITFEAKTRVFSKDAGLT